MNEVRHKIVVLLMNQATQGLRPSKGQVNSSRLHWLSLKNMTDSTTRRIQLLRRERWNMSFAGRSQTGKADILTALLTIFLLWIVLNKDPQKLWGEDFGISLIFVAWYLKERKAE